MITSLVYVDDLGIHTLEARKTYEMPNDWAKELSLAETAAEVIKI